MFDVHIQQIQRLWSHATKQAAEVQVCIQVLLNVYKCVQVLLYQLCTAIQVLL
jgi:hypothetical protein